MIKRTVSITSASYVNVKNAQLTLHIADTDAKHAVPLEDIGMLEIASLHCTVTSAALAQLAASQATVTICDHTHHPVGILLPIEGNTLHAERLRWQVEISKPTVKRAWQEIVKCKIRNQSDAMSMLGHADARVRNRIQKVKTDDSTNQEAVAASAYWRKTLAGFNTGRSPEGPFPNNLLNYGYAVLRACVARGLVSSGLHPALGLKHSNRYNAFSLADDMMEPYRPFVDAHILPFAAECGDGVVLTSDVKKHILNLLVLDTHWPEGRRPLMNGVQMSCSSLVHVLSGQASLPVFPRLCE